MELSRVVGHYEWLFHLFYSIEKAGSQHFKHLVALQRVRHGCGKASSEHRNKVAVFGRCRRLLCIAFIARYALCIGISLASLAFSITIIRIALFLQHLQLRLLRALLLRLQRVGHERLGKHAS